MRTFPAAFRRSLLLSAAVLLLAAAALAVTHATLAAQESVTLDFAWPAGAARVTSTTTATVTVMGQPTRVETGLTYRLDVAEEGGGFRLSYSDHVFDGSPMDALGAGGGEDLDRLLAEAQPDVLVGPDGAFRGLADYERVRTALETSLEPVRAEMEAQGAGGMFDDLVGPSLSEEAMSRAAELEWNGIAGFWAGRTLRVGEPVTVSGEILLPMLGNELVMVETELTLVGRVPCPGGTGAEACLELASSAAPDNEELRNLMDIFMASMMENAGGTGMEVGIRDMALHTASTLIVDAATLRPFRIETTMDMSLGMDVMGMTQTMENRQVMETVYDWIR